MKRYNEIPSAEFNGLYWYFSHEYDNRTTQSVKEPEPVLVFTRTESQQSAQMIKRFGGGMQGYLDGYLLGPVEPPLIDVDVVDVAKFPALPNIS